jgi:hypothetical protein
VWSIGGMIVTWETEVLGEKPIPVPLLLKTKKEKLTKNVQAGKTKDPFELYPNNDFVPRSKHTPSRF